VSVAVTECCNFVQLTFKCVFLVFCANVVAQWSRRP